jgi:anti-sigma regulatory factor (Ser/Thr protein kinase)
MNINYYKMFLWPHKELLKKISFTENDYWGIDIIPCINQEYKTTVYPSAQIAKIKELWINNYRFTKGFGSKEVNILEKTINDQGFSQNFGVSISELIKNTFEHGNKDKVESIAHFGYWLNIQGIIIGIKDEGEFYSRPEIFEKIQQKGWFASTKEEPSGRGIEGLYGDSDFLYVAPEQNALFAGFLFKSPSD